MQDFALGVADDHRLPVVEELYIDLLKKCLTRSDLPGFVGRILPPRGTAKRAVINVVRGILARRQLVLAKLPPEHAGEEPDPQTSGETMMGMQRLNSLERCITDVLRHNVPGDFIETGVWRGGAVIFMRAMLKICGETHRLVWVADSFEGLPKPNPGDYPHDSGDQHWKQDYYAISLDEVKANFARYGLFDDQVRFLPGWFKDTLPGAPIERLAILRLDGDMYESTMDALRHLYPRLSGGGYIIVDDYGALRGCQAAVDEYRTRHGITEPMEIVDDRQRSCVYWRKAG